MSLLGTTAGKVAAVLLAGMVVTTAGIGAALTTGVLSVQTPTVESVENGWGDISAERTGIETRVVVDNPNGVGIPGVAGVSYEVAMNDVTMASGSSGGLSLSPGRNEVTLRTHIDNEKIPAWWASHVNNGEKTTVSIRPEIDAPVVSKSLPARNRTFETDILSSFDSEANRTVEMGGRTLLTVTGTGASWGHATANRTPLSFSATMRNPNDAPLSFSKLGYEVSMNDVTVAEGTTDERVEIAPNSTGTIRIDSALDNRKLDEWWVGHLRNGEKTTLDVRVFAVAERDGRTRRVPLPFMSKRVVFETDILGGGQASTRAVETDDEFGFAPPTVGSVEREWTATDSATEFETRVVVTNPNAADSALGKVPLSARYRVAFNDVTLAEDETRATLGPGRNELAFAGEVGDRTIKRWWLSHVENGERTTLTTEASATADLGFAEVPVALPGGTRTFETDLLSGFSSTREAVEIRGRRVATLHGMAADWGEPTMARTPMVVSGKVTNARSRSLTVVKFGYEVRMNDVVLADDETPVGTTIPGGTTRNLTATGYLDNGKIPAWWVSHLRNGERSKLSVSYYAVVEFRGQTFTVQLDSMSYADTVETNAFGGK